MNKFLSPLFSFLLIFSLESLCNGQEVYKFPVGEALHRESSSYVTQSHFVKDVLAGVKAAGYLPDDPMWFLSFYYRSKDKESLDWIIKKVLQNNSLADSKKASYVVRFIASIAKQDSKYLDELVAMRAAFTADKAEILKQAIEEVKSSTILTIDSLDSMRLAWANYGATGDEQIIKDMLGFISKLNGASFNTAITDLAVHAAMNLDILDILKKLKDLPENSLMTESLGQVTVSVDLLIEEAKNAQGRAYNLRKLNKSNEALEENLNALIHCPDYGIVLNNISNIYEDQNDLDKTLLYRRAAVYINPEYSSAFYNLGRYYFLLKQYDQAIKYYKKSLEENPDQARYNHALARAYQEQNDVPNAIKYFQQYLRIEPNGEYVTLVKNYLNSVNAPLNDNSNNPVTLFREKKFDALETYLNGVLKNKAKDINGSSTLYNTLYAIARPADAEFISEQILGLLKEWVSLKPNSHFAYACLGSFYVDYGWKARGKGFSQTVVPEGWRLFNERLRKAEAYLEKSYQLNNEDPFTQIELMAITRGLGPGSFDFRANEFTNGMSLESLLNSIQKDLPLTTNDSTINILNDLLRNKSLFDVLLKKKQIILSPEMLEIRKEMDLVENLQLLIKFNRLLLEKAYPIDCPNLNGLRRVVLEEQFQRAIKADPTSYEAYYSKLVFLMPKWHGSWEEIFSFAKQSAVQAPIQTAIPKVLLDAHWEKYWYTENKDYFKNPEVWSEVKGVYLTLLGSFPKSFELRNWFALAAYYAQDYVTVKEQFDLIGNHWNEGHAWRSLKAFEDIKKKLELKKPDVNG